MSPCGSASPAGSAPTSSRHFCCDTCPRCAFYFNVNFLPGTRRKMTASWRCVSLRMCAPRALHSFVRQRFLWAHCESLFMFGFVAASILLRVLVWAWCGKAVGCRGVVSHRRAGEQLFVDPLCHSANRHLPWQAMMQPITQQTAPAMMMPAPMPMPQPPPMGMPVGMPPHVMDRSPSLGVCFIVRCASDVGVFF